MILTNNKDFYKKIFQMRYIDFKASNRFVHDNFYWNYRISGLQAALAFSQIDNVKKIIKNNNKHEFITIYLRTMLRLLHLKKASEKLKIIIGFMELFSKKTV